MCARAYQLRQVAYLSILFLRFNNKFQAIDEFISSADRKFGPITTIRQDGKIQKKIRWSAFQFDDADWHRVFLCGELLAVRRLFFFKWYHTLTPLSLQDANAYQQAFSSDKVPTLHRVIIALESLCARWEQRAADPKYALFHSAINKGLDKFTKYYRKLDNTDVYILALCE